MESGEITHKIRLQITIKVMNKNILPMVTIYKKCTIYKSAVQKYND